jgi:ribosomal-protein-alanine N-acetyltransferase
MHKIADTGYIETARMYLRLMTPMVFDKIMMELDEAELIAYLGYEDEHRAEVDRERYAKGLSTFNRSFHYFHLIEKESRKVIGWCGYHTWYLPHFRAEIGYELYEDKWKEKGLMKEALVPIINFGFEEMKLNRIEAFVGPKNEASMKLVKKFGFKHEGVMRQHYNYNGTLEDSLVFGLLREEYEQMKEGK